ncbi:MAG TPA: dethiobiotin synthase [Ideonella sp.]|uniref:dethiobiotin synthase n=1 Tax=Ideonella sp. TaxID=1929293 RepID=UPI002B938604|nr:dethiobiotin synthase [Ideonella sp.]HSI48476.1 dethiobiotin synthase [Ideonella sp.]
MASEPKAVVGCFVTGTDTGVGKTLASSALLHALRRHHARVVGMKPIASGLIPHPEHAGQMVSEDVLALRAASSIVVPPELDNPVALPEPLSPHLSAARAGQRIEIGPLVERLQVLQAQADAVVVEGAGGWLVPLNERDTMADLARAMALPVVLVVGLRLGCLNHAMLSAQAIRASGLRLAGWIANHIDLEMACPAENLSYLKAHMDAPLLGLLPWQAQPDAQACASELVLPRAWRTVVTAQGSAP